MRRITLRSLQIVPAWRQRANKTRGYAQPARLRDPLAQRMVSRMRRALALLLLASTAYANGRAPLTNGVHFKPNDPHSMYVATTFGLLISHDDGCTMNWVCEANIGFNGAWDPKYAIASDGTIFATTYTGLRVSRDGGCSFTTATSELTPGAPNRIAGIWIDALDVGPTGEVWVGTAESGQPNDVYVSGDNGVSFRAVGLSSNTAFWKSVKVAPTNLARVYVSGYELTPPTAHVFHTDNSGGKWTPSPLANVEYGSTPITLIAAVDPSNPDIVYLISEGAAGSGDKLYRSTDAGDTWIDVLTTAGPISGVTIVGPQTVYATALTQSGTTLVGNAMYRSNNGGVSFELVPNTPQLACLGVSPSGDLIGCAANWQPDFAAVVRSQDAAATFSKVWRFVEMAGPLPCTAGTPEEDTCNQAMWQNVKAQFGATGPTCGANAVPDGVQDGTMTPKSSGCCDSGGGPLGLVWACAVAGWLGRRRHASAPERGPSKRTA